MKMCIYKQLSRIVRLALCLMLLLLLARSAAAQNEDGEATDRIAVHLHEDADPHELARLHGYKNLGQVGDLEHHYVFERLHPDLHR